MASYLRFLRLNALSFTFKVFASVLCGEIELFIMLALDGELEPDSVKLLAL